MVGYSIPAWGGGGREFVGLMVGYSIPVWGCGGAGICRFYGGWCIIGVFGIGGLDMATAAGIVLGFDPGGQGNFGWSVCLTDGGNLLPPSKTGLGGDAEDVIGKVRMAMESLGLSGAKVLAAGIDAPMFWSGKRNREIDDLISMEIKKGGSAGKGKPRVLAVNSLWGSVVVQGLLLANRLYQMYEPKITETYPKVLLYLLGELERDGEMKQLIAETGSEHERDAVISAYAAWAMLNGFGGCRDIYLDEPDPVLPFVTPVSYWMPLG